MCNHDDCFTCPYPDCVWEEKQLKKRKPKKKAQETEKKQTKKEAKKDAKKYVLRVEEKGDKKRRSYQQEYYLKVRKQRIIDQAKKEVNCAWCGKRGKEIMIRIDNANYCSMECVICHLIKKNENRMKEVRIDEDTNDSVVGVFGNKCI